MEKPTQVEKWKNLQIGDTFFIEDTQYTIERVENAADMAKQYGLKINRHVPAYFLEGNALNNSHGAYDTENDIVLIYKNMLDPKTLEHEFVHVVEYQQTPTSELLDLYEKVKELITENSFEGGLFRFNFRKNIHEFIADGKTNPAFIAALKKEGLFEDFEKETTYLFV